VTFIKIAILPNC